MQIQVLKSKIHRVKVTGAELDYIGSITIDRTLMEASNLIEGERVYIVNVNNGERLSTYVIPGARDKGEIVLNGPSARKMHRGDIVLILSYGMMEFEDAKTFKPSVIFPDETNNTLVG